MFWLKITKKMSLMCFFTHRLKTKNHCLPLIYFIVRYKKIFFGNSYYGKKKYYFACNCNHPSLNQYYLMASLIQERKISTRSLKYLLNSFMFLYKTNIKKKKKGKNMLKPLNICLLVSYCRYIHHKSEQHRNKM